MPILTYRYKVIYKRQKWMDEIAPEFFFTKANYENHNLPWQLPSAEANYDGCFSHLSF